MNEINLPRLSFLVWREAKSSFLHILIYSKQSRMHFTLCTWKESMLRQVNAVVIMTESCSEEGLLGNNETMLSRKNDLGLFQLRRSVFN